jgi:type 1 glutamine amidotransferase
METAGMEGSDYQRPPYPIAWARLHGKGRVAYNAMGHREDVWDSEAFQSMLVGALKWAGGLVDADVTPNLEQVAPGHATIQPQPPPAPKK